MRINLAKGFGLEALIHSKDKSGKLLKGVVPLKTLIKPCKGNSSWAMLSRAWAGYRKTLHFSWPAAWPVGLMLIGILALLSACLSSCGNISNKLPKDKEEAKVETEKGKGDQKQVVLKKLTVETKADSYLLTWELDVGTISRFGFKVCEEKKKNESKPTKPEPKRKNETEELALSLDELAADLAEKSKSKEVSETVPAEACIPPVKIFQQLEFNIQRCHKPRSEKATAAAGGEKNNDLNDSEEDWTNPDELAKDTESSTGDEPKPKVTQKQPEWTCVPFASIHTDKGKTCTPEFDETISTDVGREISCSFKKSDSGYGVIAMTLEMNHKSTLEQEISDKDKVDYEFRVQPLVPPLVTGKVTSPGNVVEF